MTVSCTGFLGGLVVYSSGREPTLCLHRLNKNSKDSLGGHGLIKHLTKTVDRCSQHRGGLLEIDDTSGLQNYWAK